MCLKTIVGKAYGIGKGTIVVWGQLYAFNSRLMAYDAFAKTDDLEGQFCRLLHVANNRQIRPVITPGKEVCTPDVELYLRVADTCPLYYALWDENEHNCLKIVSTHPSAGNRVSMTAPWRADGVNIGTPITATITRRLRVTRKGKAQTNKPVFVLPYSFIVLPRDDLTSSESERPPESIDQLDHDEGVR